MTVISNSFFQLFEPMNSFTKESANKKNFTLLNSNFRMRFSYIYLKIIQLAYIAKINLYSSYLFFKKLIKSYRIDSEVQCDFLNIGMKYRFLFIWIDFHIKYFKYDLIWKINAKLAVKLYVCRNLFELFEHFSQLKNIAPSYGR